MKSKLLFIFFLFLFSRASAQDKGPTIDRVITTKGKVYEGHITEDHKGDYLVIYAEGRKGRTIDYSQIARVQYAVAPKPEREAPEEESTDSSAIRKESPAHGLVTFDGYRADSRVSPKMVKMRNIGIGLTIGGVVLLTAGAVVVAKAPMDNQPNGYGGTTTLPSLGTIAGAVMIVAGVGLSIPGAALWGSNAAKMKKAQKE